MVFKAGQSGNPAGRIKYPKELREAMKMNKIIFQKLLTDYLTLPLSNLEAKQKNISTPALDRIVISVIVYAIKKGDERRLDFLMNRIIGKVKDEVHHSGSMHSSIVDQLESND